MASEPLPPSPLVTRIGLKRPSASAGHQQLGRPQLLPVLASAGLTKLVLASTPTRRGRVADGEGGRKLETQQLVVASLTKDILLEQNQSNSHQQHHA